jgi:hypothetical protein
MEIFRVQQYPDFHCGKGKVKGKAIPLQAWTSP